jgi:hypothetical protein
VPGASHGAAGEHEFVRAPRGAGELPGGAEPGVGPYEVRIRPGSPQLAVTVGKLRPVSVGEFRRVPGW